MKRLRQFAPLILEELVKDEFHQPSHGQTYYEIVYIFEGKGKHLLNNRRTPYQPGDCFFISPEDTHYLGITTTTHFGVIKFTDSYFNEKKYLLPENLLKSRPEVMMRNKIFTASKLHLDVPARALLHRTVMNLMERKDRQDVATSSFIFYQLLSLFALFQEQWAEKNIPHKLQEDKQVLISYIHQHIYNPEKIQVKALAKTFNISPNYFGRFFVHHYGMGFREYVDSYRTRIIESRITEGCTLKEIADEFGFTDESHLSHYFKKKYAMTIREYRKRL
jgi:AraC-like DNA-binding protein